MNLRSAALLQRWRLTRDTWSRTRSDDIALHGIEACRKTLGIPDPEL